MDPIMGLLFHSIADGKHRKIERFISDMHPFFTRSVTLGVVVCLSFDTLPAHAFSSNFSSVSHPSRALFDQQALVAKLRVSQRQGGDLKAAEIVRSYPLPPLTSRYTSNPVSISPAPGVLMFNGSSFKTLDPTMRLLETDPEVGDLLAYLLQERHFDRRVEKLLYELPLWSDVQATLLMHCFFWISDQADLAGLFAYIFAGQHYETYRLRQILIDIVSKDESGQSLFVFVEMLSRMKAKEIDWVGEMFAADSESPAYFRAFVRLANLAGQLNEEKASLRTPLIYKHSVTVPIYRRMATVYRTHKDPRVQEFAEMMNLLADLGSRIGVLLRQSSKDQMPLPSVEEQLSKYEAGLSNVKDLPIEYIQMSQPYIDLAETYGDYLSYIDGKDARLYKRLAREQRERVRLIRNLMREQLRAALTGSALPSPFWLGGVNSVDPKQVKPAPGIAVSALPSVEPSKPKLMTWSPATDFKVGRELIDAFLVVELQAIGLVLYAALIHSRPGYWWSALILHTAAVLLHAVGSAYIRSGSPAGALFTETSKEDVSVWKSTLGEKNILSAEDVVGLFGTWRESLSSRQNLSIAVRVAFEVLQHRKGRASLVSKLQALVQAEFWKFQHRTVEAMPFRRAVLHLIQRTMEPDHDRNFLGRNQKLDPPQGPPVYGRPLLMAA